LFFDKVESLFNKKSVCQTLTLILPLRKIKFSQKSENMKIKLFVAFLFTALLVGSNAGLSAAPPKKASFTVAGNCGMCKKRIEKATSGLEGVLEAVWSTETKKMVVKYNAAKVSVSDIKKKIAAVGHDTDEFKASNDVYEKLPGCCLYDRMQ
jgi:copper chaperone CopZ